MKNKSQFIAELLMAILVAGVVSSGFVFLLILIFGNLGLMDRAATSINITGGVALGAIIGYKLNNLLRKYRQ